MVMWDFECSLCGCVFEYMTDKVEDVKCLKCFGRAKRVFNKMNFRLDGTCWSRDGYDNLSLKDRAAFDYGRYKNGKMGKHERKLTEQYIKARLGD